MTYAYWYLLAVILLPYFFAGLAKAGHPQFTNRHPRDFLDDLEGWRKRAHWVQLNSYEVFAPFACALIIAHTQDAPQASIDVLALVFLLSRAAYGLVYLLNKSTLRTLCWLISLSCTVGLFIISA